MGKPSMFSKSYEDSMRKRRRNFIIVFLLLAIVIGGGVFYLSQKTSISEIREKFKTFASSFKGEEKKDTEVDESKNNESEKIETGDTAEADEKVDEKTPDVQEEPKKEEIKAPVDQKEYVGLGQEVLVTITYIEENGVKTFKAVEASDKYTFDMLNNKVVVNVLGSQNTYIIKEDFSVTNITYPQYVSTKNIAYKKEDVMKKRESYIWCKQPTFIDDENIMYITHLPWIDDKKQEFIWMYNIKEAKFIRFPENEFRSDKSIIFGNRNGEKLELKIDEKDYLIDKIGKIVPR